jgi:hypothetical protein
VFVQIKRQKTAAHSIQNTTPKDCLIEMQKNPTGNGKDEHFNAGITDAHKRIGYSEQGPVEGHKN